MEQEKSHKKEQTETIRIYKSQKKELTELWGNGNPRLGLERVLKLVRIIKSDPSLVMQKAFEEYTNIIKAVASDNHYEHFINSGLPVVHFRFHKTGNVNYSTVKNKRFEKSIDEFEEKENLEKK